VERSQLINIGKISIRLPTVEDLIIMKAVAHRAKDILDIQGVVDANPNLDKQRIKYWLRQFAEALELPEIWLDVEKLLQD
jgi:predicted nucleotidyltransferase